MDPIRVPLEQVISIWWSMFWRWSVLGTLGGGVVGGVLGFILAFMGANKEVIEAVVMLFAAVFTIPLSIWALKVALSKRHGGYSVVLVKLDQHVAEASNSTIGVRQ